MILTILLACPSAAPDASPFAGVHAALDRDQDGVVTLAEYPASPPGGSPPAAVDKNGNGTLEVGELRDELFAVDPATFDRMAWKHGSAGGGVPGVRAPPPGPLLEALRFLADLAQTRAPGVPRPTELELAAAAAAGMGSPSGAVVLARFAAAGVDVPDAVRTAPAEPVGAE